MASKSVPKPKKATRKKAWMENLETLITKQTDSISSLTDKLSSYINDTSVDPPLAKRPKPSEDSSQPNKSDPPSTAEDDEFDRRYGHLFGLNVNDDEESEQEDDSDDNCIDDDNDEDENNNIMEEGSDGESIDGDLLHILEKNPNWHNSSSIRKFIEKTIDRPLPDEMLKSISESYTPKEDMQEFFTPPKMPLRLYKALSKMRGKNALKTEQALYSAQSEIFIVTKPIIEALKELKPLGPQVSKSRELLSISLHGYFSVSLKISKARRSNVRFLFKEALAEVLYSTPPNHVSLFGGEDFSSQVEKAAKEAKLDFSWSKPRKQPFRLPTSKGFQNRNYNYNRQNNNNNKKSGFQKKKANSNNANKPKAKDKD